MFLSFVALLEENDVCFSWYGASQSDSLLLAAISEVSVFAGTANRSAEVEIRGLTNVTRY